MATFIGIDGIPNGWVAVYLSNAGTQRFAYAQRVIATMRSADTETGRPDRRWTSKVARLPRGSKEAPVR